MGGDKFPLLAKFSNRLFEGINVCPKQFNKPLYLN